MERIDLTIPLHRTVSAQAALSRTKQATSDTKTTETSTSPLTRALARESPLQ